MKALAADVKITLFCLEEMTSHEWIVKFEKYMQT